MGVVAGRPRTSVIALALAFYAWLSPCDRRRHARGARADGLSADAAGLARARRGVACSSLAWIGQFIGHTIEGRKPSFFEDIKFLLVGPAWLLGFVYRRARHPCTERVSLAIHRQPA